MAQPHTIARFTLATLSLSVVLASCGGPQDVVTPALQGSEVAAAQVRVSDLPIDTQLTRSPLQEQATERYNITLKFAPGSSASVMSAMQTAAARWEGVVTQGLPSYRANIRAESCGSNAAYVGTIDGSNPTYQGGNGLREYRAVGGTLGSVPVENQGGPGTAGGHWREATFKTELMTGYLNSGVFNPLSRLSVGTLQDMGYAVNYGAADAYRIPSLGSQGMDELLDLGGREQLTEPTYRSE